MRKAQYQLLKHGKVLFTGTYDECLNKLPYKIERVEDVAPIYEASYDDGKSYRGTIDELCKQLNMTRLNVYNYTRYKRKKDGLFIARIN